MVPLTDPSFIEEVRISREQQVDSGFAQETSITVPTILRACCCAPSLSTSANVSPIACAAAIRICRGRSCRRSSEARLLPMPEHLWPGRLLDSYRDVDSAPLLAPNRDRDTGVNTSNRADFDPVYRICAEAPAANDVSAS